MESDKCTHKIGKIVRTVLIPKDKRKHTKQIWALCITMGWPTRKQPTFNH